MLFRSGLLYCVILVACEAASPIMPRIVGGTASAISKIPYQIALYLNNQFTCGGSLITRSCILTAGHCVAGRPISALKIRAGITFLSDMGGETRTVLQVYTPTKFNMRSLHMDAAILRLNAPVTGTNSSRIELSDEQLKVGDQFQISGWGLTAEKGTTVSNQLRVVTVETISTTHCTKEYPLALTSTMFCARVRGGGRDACTGDSGGPAVKDGRQIGIVSWGRGCARTNSPGVYTSAKHILPWVNRVTRMYCAIK